MMLLVAVLGLFQLIAVHAIPAPIDINQCPDPRGMRGPCVERCLVGTRCGNGLICCRNGCGTSCMKPVDPCKTKKCPKDHKCVLEDIKCIRAPCPKMPRCIPTLPPVHPCKTKKCPKDHICVIEDIMCIRAPCPRVLPRCVPLPPTNPCEGECNKSEACLTLSKDLSVCVPWKKSGFCHRSFDKMACPHVLKPQIDECNHDYDCKNRLKCCKVKCGGKRCAPPSWFTKWID